MKKPLILLIVLVLIIGAGFVPNWVFGQVVRPSGRFYFWQLWDTPDTYVSQAGKGIRVNSEPDGLEFFTLSLGDFDNQTAWRIFYSNTAGDVTELALGANGTFLESNGATSAPAFRVLATGDIPDISATYQPLDATLTDIADGTINENLVNTANPWAVNEGGTGAATFTDGGVLLGSGTGAITAMGVLANGSIVVGDGTTDPVALAVFTNSTGDVKHEAGGLEADVSGYTDGIYGMASGATLDIDTEAELETALGGLDVVTVTSNDISSANLITALSDETGSGVAVFGTAPTFTTSIQLTGVDADPAAAAGTIAYDSTIAVMSGGAIRWYDDNSVRLIVDLETDPVDGDDDKLVAYDSAADGFYMKADADTGGSTLYNNIGDPTGAGSISFDDTETATYTTVQDTAGSFISFINSNADVSNQVYMLDLDYSADTTQDNADFIRLQDAGSTLVVFEEEGKITMTPSGVDDAMIISITPSVALTAADAAWYGIKIDGDALDPGDVDNTVIGIDVDLSGVDLTNNPYVEALELIMPTGGVALHIEEGKIKQGFTSGSDAGAEYTAIDMFMDASSQATTSETHAIDVAVVGGDPAGLVVAVGTHTYVAPVHQHIGVFSTPDQAGADSEAGFFDDSGTDYIDGVDGIEQFSADDDAIWISAATVFTELEVIMGTPATRSITPTFWYWKDLGVDAWTQFFPADDTDGFQQSGTIRWETTAVPDWLSADVVNISAGDAGEAAAGYWIAIIRTVNADPGTPTPTTVKTGAITEYSWDETGAIDVLSLEADTITEGGIAVHNNDQMDASSELAAIIDDETGTGLIVFNDQPNFNIGLNVVRLHDTAAQGPFVVFGKKRDGDPTDDVSSGDYTGIINFRGYHTDGYDDSVHIRAIVDNTPGNGDMPGRLEFLTSADGSVSPTLRVAIDSAGNTKMGDGAWTNYTNVSINGTITPEGTADLELPQASPAVPDADGEIEIDFTDGKMVIQHGSAHAELGASTDVVMGSLIESWSATIYEPDGVNDVLTVKAINSIEFPHGVVITAIYLGISSDTNYVLTVQNFDDFDTINAGDGTIDTVTYTADTTGEIIDSTPTYATIAAGQIIMISIPSTDVDWIHFEIYYYEPAA